MKEIFRKLNGNTEYKIGGAEIAFHHDTGRSSANPFQQIDEKKIFFNLKVSGNGPGAYSK